MKDVLDMTPEEVKEWEKEQDNSNDIYKVNARITNLARESGGSLTPVGIKMCNLYTHVLKDMYDFAETIQDKDVKTKLQALIRTHEKFPKELLSVSGVRKR